ncbi:PREDICTED: growth-regulating factor 7-like [Erythranthe guttata]|uniref:growth-regulating factor 7-like n=1 Tax=Erythranthe guttata TaxID=4155 RepID=UPI00064D9377|nr:PREDICTED: growth-regulating factor 7-like [Erythranthe guttata]|eukprot:XP_012843420.1 PREDICTED: growth-regulating factor 7-like [Erythranthe guttata]
MDLHRHRPVDAGGANEAAAVGRDDPSSSYSTTTTAPPYKSLGGGGMAAAFPFTCAQWKELERQAMIYKYMISSVPVPPNLLFPLSRTDNYSPSSLVYNGGGYSKNGDLEPGRCKRTDGKKWRCSREVAPGHKYCERHLHRGRPRSRKPVELAKNDAVLLPNKKTRLQHQHLPISTPTTSLHLAAASATTTTTTLPKSDPTISSYKGFNRDMGFGFANEGSSIYGSTPIFHQDYYMDQLQLNMLPYNPTMEIGPQATGFIDAWSTDNLNTNNQNNNGSNEYSLSWMNRGDFSPSLDLSIAMAAGNFIDSEMGNVRMGADHEENTIKDSDSSMPSPVFWEPFGRGGPLAEALQVTSPRECSIGTPATTVSSPSGVVYNNNNNSNSRTDHGSVCNSPTFHRFS